MEDNQQIAKLGKNGSTRSTELAPEKASTSALPKGMVPVASDLRQYKPDTCGATALQGYLVDLQDMPPTDNGPWSIFVVCLTAPTKSVDRDDVLGTSEIGDYVSIAVTHALKPLAPYARHAALTFEVFIKPKTKIKLGAGKTMWTYDCGAHPKAVKRIDVGIMPPGAPASAPAVLETEIPF